MSVILLLGALVVTGAALLGGVVGFSYALVALPLMLLVGVPLPDVVITNLLVGLATRVGVLVRYRRDVERTRVVLLLGGCVPGLLLAVLVRASVPAQALQLLAVVVVVLCGVGVLLPRRPDPPLRRPHRPATVGRGALVATGLGSGFLAATTSLSGVLPAAVLNRSATSSRAFRAELAAVLVIGNLMALVALLATAHPSGSQLTPTRVVTWLLVGLLGNAVGNAVADRLPERLFARVVRLVVLSSGLVVLMTTVAHWPQS